jgi:hypothetical protein
MKTEMNTHAPAITNLAEMGAFRLVLNENAVGRLHCRHHRRSVKHQLPSGTLAGRHAAAISFREFEDHVN